MKTGIPELVSDWPEAHGFADSTRPNHDLWSLSNWETSRRGPIAHTAPLGQYISPKLISVGKAEKTIFLCDYLASRETQYEVNDGLQVVENWNATSDIICYGRRGELATNSREQQDITLLSLQLLQNCLMLVNTILVERTLEKHGLWERLNPEDRRALTPLFHTHINPYGLFELDLESPSFLIAA